MATLDVADFLKQQQQRLDQARGELSAARQAAETGRGLSPEVVRQSREREIAELKAQLARSRAAREQVVARYEGEIKRLEEAITRLEEDGRRIDEVLGGGGGVRPPRRAAAAAGKKAAGKKTAKPRATKARKG